MNLSNIFNVLFKNEKWSGFEKSIQLQEEYNTFFHAKNVEQHLRRIKKRETDEELAERITCTNFLNDSLYRYLTRNVDKLSYLNANITITKDEKTEFKKTIANVFDNKDLRQYIHSCLTDDMLCDPNGLLVFMKDEDELVKPNFINSNQIVWKKTLRGEVKEVMIKTEMGYIYKDAKFEVIFIETQDIGSDYTKIENEVPDIITDVKNKKSFKVISTPIDNSLPFVTVGYKHDKDNKDIYVSFLDSAISYFKKITSIGSEYDITELKQAFPKVFAYETKCEGTHEEPCNQGYCATTDSDCGKCHGTGVLVSKSGQDAIVIPMPDMDRGGELADLSKLYHEVKAPIETLEYQRKVIKETFEAALESIYGKQDEAKVNKTATARLIELELTNQSLFPFAENIKRIYESSILIISNILGINDQSVSFKFPQKLIELNESELIELIEFAKKNSLPSYIIGEYESRLAQSIFKQNSFKSQMYVLNRALNPFPDKEIKELVILLDNNAISKDDFILAVNFDKFLNQIAERYFESNTTIQNQPISKVKDELKKVLTEYKTTLEQEPILTLDS